MLLELPLPQAPGLSAAHSGALSAITFIVVTAEGSQETKGCRVLALVSKAAEATEMFSEKE